MKKARICLLLCGVLMLGAVSCGSTAKAPSPDTKDASAGTPETEKIEGETDDTTAVTEASAGQIEKEAVEATADESVEDVSDQFYITEITDDVWKRIEGKSYKEDCTVPLEDLRYIHVLHKDIFGVTHEGEMVCNAYIADDLIEIFRTLYNEDYPIEKMRLVDEYDADDEASMEDNNSSCFNFRFISHTNRVSKHGLGLAVDINTLYNPYIKYVDGERVLEPITAEDYLDREKIFDYKIEKGDLCYKLFTEHGFEWGGEWIDRKDYQHFEIPTDVIEREGLGR